MREDPLQAQGIEHPVLRNAALSGDRHAPFDEIELADGMGVRVDAEHAAQIEGFSMPAPVELQPVRVAVDLDCKEIGRAYGCPDGINSDVERVDVPTDMAIPLTFIVNELVTKRGEACRPSMRGRLARRRG